MNEADLHARHRWLVERRADLLARLEADPEYSDAKIAGWWVWGISAWIGNGWCHSDDRLASPAGAAPRRQLPMIGTPGNGVHAPIKGAKVLQLVPPAPQPQPEPVVDPDADLF